MFVFFLFGIKRMRSNLPNLRRCSSRWQHSRKAVECIRLFHALSVDGNVLVIWVVQSLKFPISDVMPYPVKHSQSVHMYFCSDLKDLDQIYFPTCLLSPLR